MNAHITLTNDQRSQVRSVIKNHPRWTEWRTAHGITMADMTSARCLEFCSTHGVDVSQIIEIADTFEADGVEEAQVIQETPPTRAPVADGVADPAAALGALKALLGGSVDADAVRAIVDEAVKPIKAIVEDQAPVMLVVKDGMEGVRVEGLRHNLFEDLLRAATCRDGSGRVPSIWLSGPSQSGKTTAAEMVAEALDLPFGFHGAMTMAHELTGFVDAGGKYHSTQFVERFEHGGVCLLDEIDAGSNEALLALNAALANGIMSLPDGRLVKRHHDFICIGAANTWGVGATADYIGRAKLDGAFLQRFPVKLTWGYDAKLEKAMCGNPEFAMRVQTARKAAEKAGLKVLITPAHAKAGAALIAGGFSEDDAAKLTYLAGLTPEQVQQVEG